MWAQYQWSQQAQQQDQREYPHATSKVSIRHKNFSKIVKTYQVCGNDSIQGFWLQDHSCRHGVNQHLVNLHVRKILRNFSRDGIPHDHAISLCIALGHDGDVFFWPLLRCLKSKPHDSLYAMPSENRNLGCSFPGLPSMRDTAMASVFSFTVLSDNHPVKLPVCAVAERRLSALEHLGRANIGKLLEWLTNS